MSDMNDSSVTSDDRLWAAFSYVLTPLTAIIVLLMADKKDRPFVKAHTMQALVYGAVISVVWLIGTVVSLGILGLCLTPISFVAWLVALYWAYKAYQGEMVTIPVITDFVKNQGWV